MGWDGHLNALRMYDQKKLLLLKYTHGKDNELTYLEEAMKLIAFTTSQYPRVRHSERFSPRTDGFRLWNSMNLYSIGHHSIRSH